LRDFIGCLFFTPTDAEEPYRMFVEGILKARPKYSIFVVRVLGILVSRDLVDREELVRGLMCSRNCKVIAEKVYSEIVKLLSRLGVGIVDLKSKSRGFRIVVKEGTRIIGSVREGVGEYVVVTVRTVKPIPLSIDYKLFGDEEKSFLMVKKIIDIVNNVKIPS